VLLLVVVVVVERFWFLWFVGGLLKLFANLSLCIM
jgi:hypothetical protein